MEPRLISRIPVNENFIDNAMRSPLALGLSDLRQRIDSIDEAILRLVAERAEWVRDVQNLKRASGLPVRSHDRERYMFARARRLAGGLGLAGDEAVKVIRQCIASCLSAAEVERKDDTRAAG